MSEAIAGGKYGILFMADLEGAFDALWRNRAIYKLCKAGLRKNLLSSFSSFLNNRHSRNLVNSYISDWFLVTERGVPQDSVLSPFIFLVYTADLTMEDTSPYNPSVSSQVSHREFKYTDDVEIRRAHTDIYQTFIVIQIPIIDLQNLFNMANISKCSKNHMFCDQRKERNYPSRPLTINGVSLNKVSNQRILVIIIDNNLSFSPHINNITNKCKKVYNRLTLFLDM